MSFTVERKLKILMSVFTLLMSFSALADDVFVAAAPSGRGVESPNPDRGSSTARVRKRKLKRRKQTDVNAIGHGSTTAEPVPKPEVSSTPFGFAAYMEVDSAPQGSSYLGVPAGSTFIQYFAELDYALTANSTVYIRPSWSTNFAPADSKITLYSTPGASTKLWDTVVGYNQKNIFQWDNGGAFNFYSRYYLPTGEMDRVTGQEGEVYFRGNITQPVNRWFTVQFDTKFWWAFQQYNSFDDPNNPANQLATFDKEVTPYFTGVVKLMDHLKFYQSVGLDYVWMNSGAEYSMVYLDSSIGTDLIPNVELRLGVNDEPTMNAPQNPSLFAPTEYYYYLWLVFSI